MKTTTKKQMRIIAFLAIIVFSLTACSKPEKDKKLSGTVTANAEGTVLFQYSRSNCPTCPETCKFTTDLLTPNDQFVLSSTSEELTGKKEITGLTAGQKVNWTATVEGKPVNIGSGYFVHIINE